MNVRKKLIELKKQLLKKKDSCIDDGKYYDLDHKINKFIDWSLENVWEGKENDLRNFIEKMTAWYEIRFTDWELEEIIGSAIASKKLDDIFYDDIPYSFRDFYNSLTDKEKYFFEEPNYQEVFYRADRFSFSISERGIFENCSSTFICDKSSGSYKLIKFCDKFEGVHVKDFQNYALEEGLNNSNVYNFVDKVVKKHDNEVYFKDGILDCVMYRLMEHGHLNGVKRAFLFAKEFNRDTAIPVMYGFDENDQDILRLYLQEGGSKLLDCYVNYDFEGNNDNVEIEAIHSLLKRVDSNFSNEEVKLKVKQ